MQNIDFTNKTAELGIFIGKSEYRHQGIGSVVLNLFLEKIYSALELQKIYLKVLSFNATALELYKHAGFVVEKIEHNVVCKKGEFVDVIYMAKSC